jgi:PAP2 superfamily
MSPAIAYWSSIANLHPQRNRHTLELLGAALRLANHVEMRFKHALACRRPSEYSPQMQPMLATPGHGTLPSGHATEAHTVAQVLWALLSAADSSRDDAWFEQLMRQASRIAVNRTVAGLHFPVDSAAGQLLGLTLGDYLVKRALQPAQGQATYDAWHFVGTAYGAQDDFEWRRLYQAGGSQRLPQPGPFAVRMAHAQKATPSKMLNWLWEGALKECQ